MEKLKIERMNGMTEEELNKGVEINIQLDIDKMNRIYAIEEELGIPLEVLFKALKDGVYAKFEEGKILKADIKLYYSCHNEFEIRVVCLEIGQYEDFEWEDYLFVKNYGKTWALTEEELE